MQIMIDIPDQMYQKIKETNMIISGRRSGKTFDYILFNAINTGIPLPKGHGRLIDDDALNIRMEQRMDEIGDDESIWESSNVATALDMFAPTIIEADGGDAE